MLSTYVHLVSSIQSYSIKGMTKACTSKAKKVKRKKCTHRQQSSEQCLTSPPAVHSPHQGTPSPENKMIVTEYDIYEYV